MTRASSSILEYHQKRSPSRSKPTRVQRERCQTAARLSASRTRHSFERSAKMRVIARDFLKGNCGRRRTTVGDDDPHIAAEARTRMEAYADSTMNRERYRPCPLLGLNRAPRGHHDANDPERKSLKELGRTRERFGERARWKFNSRQAPKFSNCYSCITAGMGSAAGPAPAASRTSP